MPDQKAYIAQLIDCQTEIESAAIGFETLNAIFAAVMQLTDGIPSNLASVGAMLSREYGDSARSAEHAFEELIEKQSKRGEA